MHKLFIYLSGSIKKGNRTHVSSFWGDKELALIAKEFRHIDYGLLNPATRSDNLSDMKSTFGRDMLQVFLSDLIIVDGREKRGVGVGAEMFFAKQINIPVFSMIPRDSHYHSEKIEKLGQTIKNWTHPFMFNLSDKIEADLLSILNLIKANIINLINNSSRNNCVIKNQHLNFVFEAINHYLNTQLKNDTEMLKLTLHEKLKKRIKLLQKTK